MKYKLFFNIPIYTDDHSAFPRPVIKNYDYWVPLIKYFLTKSDTIEIHCWNEEIETIDEIKALHTFEMVTEENLTIFKGNNTLAVTDYLLNNNINKNGELKWFTLNLEKDLISVMHSGHWGTEYYADSLLEKDIAFIKSVTPNGTGFHQFQ